MSHQLARFSLQTVLLAVLSLLLVLGPTLGIAHAQGLDLNRHCQNHGRERAVNTDGTAYGWKCEDSSGVLWDISVESACDEQYGSSYTAQYSNYNDPNSWYCQAPASSQPNPQPQGRGCDISRFDVSPSGSVTLGTDVSLYGESNCGTTKFTINGQSRSETGQPNNSMTWRTSESGTGNYNVCFLARGNGGWENADSECRNISVVSAQQSQPQQQPQPQVQPTQAPATSGGTGTSSCFMPLSIGDRGQITAGVANNLRSGAGTGYSRIGSLQPFTQFTVLDGPFSANGYCWIYIQLDNGTTGYTATGSAADPWVEWVSEESSDGDYELNPTVIPSSNSTQITVISVWFEPNNFTYQLEVDNQCRITNGAEIISQEIYRYSVWADNLSYDRLLQEARYLAEGNSVIEDLRLTIERQIKDVFPSCSVIMYQVGGVPMDTSGLGNILFGWAANWLGWSAESAIGHGAQMYTEHRFDYPDDQSQIRMGWAMAADFSNDNYPSEGDVITYSTLYLQAS